MRKARFLLGGITAALVVGVALWEWRHLNSPGPLHPSHAVVSALQGSRGCQECHGKTETAMADACATCHTEVKQQFAQSEGLHGSIQRANPQACGTCHVEHSGSNVPLVSARSFLAAGFADPKSFDHSKLTSFKLAGRHDELSCRQCHPNADKESLAKDQPRFLGLKQECVSCHKDVHEGTFGAECLSCHGQAQQFKLADGFTHTSKFALEGVHAKLTCAKCHEKSGPTAVVALYRADFTVRTCASCHKDPHEGSLGPTCETCHGTTMPFKRPLEYKHTEAFPLAGGHGGLACKQCHEKAGANSVASLMLTKLPVRSCEVCHQSPHRQPLVAAIATASGKLVGQACVVCHLTESKSFLSPAAKMTAAQHAATGFPLDRPHEKVQCAQCHKEIEKRAPLAAGPELPTRFAALFPGRQPQSCEACHADPHRGQFSSSFSEGKCVVCHSPTHFKPNNFDLTLHDKATFALTGSHKAVSCTLCHKKQQEMVRFIPTPAACVSCHADVHAGKFDTSGKELQVAGKSDCARCHTTSGFTQVKWTAADHAKWTGYPLNAAHVAVACNKCHRPLPRPDARGRSFGVAQTSCNACHADPHAGQFVKQNVTDCARCHTDSAKFAVTTFDHEKDSIFKLDAVHVKLQCAACHKPEVVAGLSKVIRYRPLGTRCQDCHGPGIEAIGQRGLLSK